MFSTALLTLCTRNELVNYSSCPAMGSRQFVESGVPLRPRTSPKRGNTLSSRFMNHAMCYVCFIHWGQTKG